MKFYIIDDDIASRRMLSRLIANEPLGEVVGDLDDAILAEEEIIYSKPDIVLIDLLMPGQDGIETVEHLKDKNFKGKFIMISEVINKDMVAKAYERGIEYFIHKPINRVEVAAVVNKIKEQIKMEDSLQKIRESLSLLRGPFENDRGSSSKDLSRLTNDILADLGILGENGSKDLVDIMKYLHESNQFQRFAADNMPLKELFYDVLKKNTTDATEKEIKAFEQRLRRAVNQAMVNVASLGLTDYSNPKFEDYATKYFDFNEIRIKIGELEENGGKRARINLRKFIYALYTELRQRVGEDQNS